MLPELCQTAVAFPFSSSATLAVSPPYQCPATELWLQCSASAARKAVVTTKPCVQLTIASPRRFMANSITLAWRPRRDRLCGGPKLPPAGRDATCAAVQIPFERSRPTIASPAPSTVSTGADASCPGVDKSSGWDHVPSAARTEAWIKRCAPSPHCQVATAPPWSSSATAGEKVRPIGPEIVCASDQGSASERLDVRTIGR